MATNRSFPEPQVQAEDSASLLDQIVAENKAAIGARYMPTLTVKQFSEREKMLQEIKGMLVEGIDYGKIPGTGPKPVLLKPGAEKLCTFFGYAPKYDETYMIEDWTGANYNGEPLFYYKYTCTLLKDEKRVGEAMGSCNSWETKYRYRSANRVCPRCGAEAIIAGKQEYGGGFICFAKKGGCGAKFRDDAPEIIGQATGRIPNAEFADIINTCQKMGQKRAYVAATLSATGASQYFTQDLEDITPPPQQAAPAPVRSEPHYEPEQSDAAEPPVEEPPPNHNLITISEPQQKRIFALMKSVGKSPDDVLEIILRKGFNSTKEITKDRYEAICNEILRPKDV